MFLRSKLSRVLAAGSLVAALACVSSADTLRLKDGSIIKGKITSFTSGKFTVVIGDGSRRREMMFSAGEVESIKFDEDSTSASTTAPTRRYDPVQPPQVVEKKPAPETNVSTQQPQAQDKPRFKDWNTSQKPPVLQNSTKPQAQPSEPRVIQTSATGSQPGRIDPAPAKPTPNTTLNPIGWNVKVLADNTGNGWTNTGWVVKKGQKIRITGDGTVDLGKGKTSTPSGDPDIPDQQKLLKNVATGALIAVIGDDNNDFIYIGAEREFTASRDGALFLGLNEGYLDDNKGAYNVKVEIIPDNR